MPYNIFYLSKLRESKAILEALIKRKVINELPEWAEIHSKSGAQKPFLEPFVFTYFNYGNRSKNLLRQILYGYMPAKQRYKKLELVTNSEGVAYLPNFGYLKTGRGSSKILIASSKSYTLRGANGKAVDSVFQAAATIPNSRVELIIRRNLLCDQIFEKLGKLSNIAERVEVDENPEAYVPYIEGALRLIKKFSPQQYAEIDELLMKMAIIKAKRVIAFTEIETNGAIFIRPRGYDKELFFAEHIIHEVSHMTLNLILLDPKEYFAIDPFQNRFSSPFRADERGAFQVLQAVFVLARIASFFNILIKRKAYKSELEQYELIGRLVSKIDKLEQGLGYINSRSIYTAKGYNLYKSLQHVKEKVKSENRLLLQKYKRKGQGNEFDLQKFLSENSVRLKT